MIKGIATALLGLILTVGVSSCSPSPAVSGVDAEKEAEAVRRLYAGATQAAIDKDWEAYEGLWAHDATIELLHPDAAEWLVGWDEIEPRMREMFRADLDLRVERDSMQVHIGPSGEMAWATQEHRLHIRAGADEEHLRQWSTLVFRKIDGRWRMVHAQASLVPFETP